MRIYLRRLGVLICLVIMVSDFMEKEFSDVNDLVLDTYNTNELLQNYQLQGEVDAMRVLCKRLLEKLDKFSLYYIDE